MFDLLALQILNKKSVDEDVKYFALIRAQGESAARKNNPNREITISDIYKYCDFSKLTSIPNSDIMEREINIESDVLYANPEVKNQIIKLHNKEKSICFISDMYLPAEFLKTILIREGLYKDGDRLFVSSEIGLTKSSGQLYDWVMDILKINPYQLIHKGDNFHSDFLVPFRKGILAKLYRRSFTYYENLQNSLNTCPTFDYNYINSCISNGVIHNRRSATETFAADFIAPILVPFVYNILLRSRKKHITKLYFLARDGYIPYVIAREFATQFPEIEIRYLYVSRRSLYLPSLDSFSKENKDRIITKFKNHNLSQTRDYLQLDFNLDEYVDIKDSTELIDYLFESGKCQDIELTRIEQSNLIIEYFKQEGVASKDENIAIVDVRGTLRTQNAMNEILLSNRYKPVYGFYLEVQENRLLNLYKSEYEAILKRESYTQIKAYRNLNRAADIFEQYFCITDQNRTKSYIRTENNCITPAFEINDYEKKVSKKELMNINIEICRRYIHLFSTSGLLYVDPLKIINSSLFLFSNFLNNPRKPYTNALYNVIASQNKYEYKYIISDITLKHVKNRRIQWYDGSVKRNFGSLGLIIYQICYKILKILK